MKLTTARGSEMNALDLITLQAQEVQAARVKAQRDIDEMRRAVDKLVRTVQACKDQRLLEVKGDDQTIPASELIRLSLQEVIERLTPAATKIERMVADQEEEERSAIIAR